MRVLWIHASSLLAIYLVSLTVYFGRLPGTLDTRLAASVGMSGLLEIVLLLSVAGGLLGFGALRQSRLRAGLYAIVVLAFTMAYLAQIYALWISNAFISTLAIENAQDATLSASLGQYVMLVAGAAAWLVMFVASWRGAGIRWSRRGLAGCAAIALAASLGVAAFNRHAPVAGGTAQLAPGQSPVGALVRVGISLLHGTNASLPQSLAGGQSLCGVELGSGRFPFLKQDINAQPLPFATLRPVTRPNVIMLFIEGESARLFETYGGRYPGLTPNISRMAGQSMVIDNYFSHTAATYRGLQGQLTSGYPLHGGADNGIGWTDGNASGLARHVYASLPGILRKRGYETVFFSPHLASEALTPFVRMLGFDDVYTAMRSHNELLEDPDPLYNDALTDRDSYRALTAYLQQRRQASPFVIGLYSLDTHAFMDIPKGGVPYGDGSHLSLNTLHTLDAEFGAFYDYFMASKYADNTLLVLTVDHAHYPEPPFVQVAGSDYKPYFIDSVPMLIHAPWLQLPARFDAHGRTSLDFAPTLLQLLGIDKGSNSFLGHSIFDRSHDRNFSIAAMGRSVYAIYQGQVYAPNEIPQPISEGYAQCKVLTESYYAHENANTIFPADPAQKVPGGDALDAIGNAPAPITVTARPAGYCALDTIDGAAPQPGVPASIDPGQMFAASGWVVDGKMQSPTQFTLLLQGRETYGFEGKAGGSRPDVGKSLGTETAARSGFRMVIKPGRIPTGTYEVATLLKGPHGDEICDTRKQLTVGR